MKRANLLGMTAGVLMCTTHTAAAVTTPQASLNNCQKAVKTAAASFVSGKTAAIGACLQAISTQLIQKNAPDASKAAATCVKQFRLLNDSRNLGKSLPEKLSAGITPACAPGQPKVTHTLGDILGSGAGVPQPIDAGNVATWCKNFGGNATIASLQDWIDCVAASQECGVDAAVSTQYPRALEWLGLVKPAMQALTPPAADPNQIADAVAALNAVVTEMTGAGSGAAPQFQCGDDGVCAGSLATCTANLGTCAGNLGTCNTSLSTCTGNLGTCSMNLSTTQASLDACTGNLGTCNGSLSACSANYAGCSGNLATCNSGTATAADVLSGKTFSSSAGLGLTGTVPAGANVNGPNAALTFTIPDGFYNGSKTATANDTNLAAGNVVSGATIFGVAGSQPPSQPLKTGQTTAYGTGSDGDLQKGDARQYTDNGDGTITDNKTGLMWEKKDLAAGGIHNWGDTYTWGMDWSPGTMNGTMVTTFLAALNTPPCFAGHCDWRIPNVNELQSLANYQNVNPAVDPAFNTSCAANCTVDGAGGTTKCSCTRSDFYWSSTTAATGPGAAWDVYFSYGFVSYSSKSVYSYVRAVRGGL